MMLVLVASVFSSEIITCASAAGCGTSEAGGGADPAAGCGTSEAGGGAGPAAGAATALLGAGVDTVTSSNPGIDAN